MNLLISLAFLVAFVAVPVYLGSPCPVPATIVPCSCSKDNQDTLINCRYHDPAILKLAFKQIASQSLIIDFFNVSSTRLNVIESNFFLDMTVRNVLLYGDRWSSIADDAFAKQENSLGKIAIQESLLTAIPSNAISILQDLRVFEMVNSEVTAIASNAFENFKSAAVLRILDLQHNYIKFIGAGAFTKLTGLRILLLNDNRIRSLPAATLPPSNRIGILDISNNQLEEVFDDIKELPVAAQLAMESNFIEDISGVNFKTIITNKLQVNISANPLKCGCNMAVLASTTEEQIAGTCSAPTALAGRELSSLTSADFTDCFLNMYLNLNSLSL